MNWKFSEAHIHTTQHHAALTMLTCEPHMSCSTEMNNDHSLAIDIVLDVYIVMTDLKNLKLITDITVLLEDNAVW
jgi:hypothetical protein